MLCSPSKGEGLCEMGGPAADLCDCCIAISEGMQYLVELALWIVWRTYRRMKKSVGSVFVVLLCALGDVHLRSFYR